MDPPYVGQLLQWHWVTQLYINLMLKLQPHVELQKAIADMLQTHEEDTNASNTQPLSINSKTRNSET